MVDRVVLPPLDQPEQVRELQGNQPRVLDQRAQPRGEPADVRHVREDVVGGDQVRLAVLGGDRGTRLRAEELHHRPDALGDGGLGDVAGWLNAEHRDTCRDEVLQQVAVVARDLGDEAVGSQAKRGGHLIRVPLGVGDPRVGVRREVRVLGEDVLASHVRGELDEQALLAKQDVQRIEHLGRVDASPPGDNSRRAETSRGRRRNA